MVRLRDFQSRMAKQPGFPTRLTGKMRINAPWLPSWAGGALWSDPMKQIFPFEQYLTPFEQMATQQSNEQRQAETILYQMAKDGKATDAEVTQAVKTHSGPLWERAFSQAQLNSQADSSNPLDFMNLIMSPALYLSVPSNIIAGTPQNISPLPITRTAESVQTALQGTPMEWLGKVVGLAAKPEE